MVGLEVSEKYFRTLGLPMIRDKFGVYMGRIAAGLVGEGSECFGFDDEFSRDHDWGPAFCIWLPEQDFKSIGGKLQKAVLNLPRTFMGFGPRQESEWGAGRTGVFEISEFYGKFIGKRHLPATLDEWLALPENYLAVCTNGKVFQDPLGWFSRWRETLLAFYPEDVRLKKIAARCMSIAQSGQYNLTRCIKRNEVFAAQYAETKFCADAISMIFLLNKRYTPFYKWMHRALRDLPILGLKTHEKINQLISSDNHGEKFDLVEDICSDIISELKAQSLSDSGSDFLLDHGPVVQQRIKDPQMKQRHVLMG